MLANPIRLTLRDGFRCIMRYERVWLTFALLGFSYFIFQVAIFSPIPGQAELDYRHLFSFGSWQWPALSEAWQEAPLPSLESVAGIFDNATTTYPFSVLAAILFLSDWRGLHRALWQALRRLYGRWSIPIYLLLLTSALAALAKPLVYWKLPEWNRALSTARLLRVSASVDAVSFIFEYFVGVYIQVYLITVCLAWIKGLSFRESALFGFAMRRFSYVLEWAGVVVLIGMLGLRLPLLLAYFLPVPDVLDYLPLQRAGMSAFILVFCSVQIALVLHNETLGEALRSNFRLLRRDLSRVAWFFLLCGLHFFLILTLDAAIRAAIADRALALLGWKVVFVFVRALVTGWLLASWVVLFRRGEAGRQATEAWIAY